MRKVALINLDGVDTLILNDKFIMVPRDRKEAFRLMDLLVEHGERVFIMEEFRGVSVLSTKKEEWRCPVTNETGV